MKTRKSTPSKSIFIISIVVLLCSCGKEAFLIQDSVSPIATRSCQTVSQSWVDQLKALGAAHYSVASNQVEVTLLQKVTPTTFTIVHHGSVVGQSIVDESSTLFLITHDGFGENVMGYYDAVNLNLCSNTNTNNSVVGNVGDIVSATLGILGVDQDNF